jgi:hypothetical protein
MEIKDENNKEKPLNSIIEKIIERGEVSREDQLNINHFASRMSSEPGDFMLLCDFIDMIKDGKIKVLS